MHADHEKECFVLDEQDDRKLTGDEEVIPFKDAFRLKYELNLKLGWIAASPITTPQFAARSAELQAQAHKMTEIGQMLEVLKPFTDPINPLFEELKNLELPPEA